MAMAELKRSSTIADSATTVITLDVAASVGDTVVVCAWWSSYNVTQRISGVSDARSNTYTTRVSATPSSATYGMEIYTSQITTGLSISDTVTISWSGPTYTYRTAYVCKLAGSPTYNVSKSAVSPYGTTVSASESTTAASCSGVGFVLYPSTKTYGSSSWSVSGTTVTNGSKSDLVYQDDLGAAGAKDPGGAISANDWWGCVWVACAPAATSTKLPPHLLQSQTLGLSF